MAKFKNKNKKTFKIGGEMAGGYSTPKGTFDADGTQVAGPVGSEMSSTGSNMSGYAAAVPMVIGAGYATNDAIKLNDSSNKAYRKEDNGDIGKQIAAGGAGAIAGAQTGATVGSAVGPYGTVIGGVVGGVVGGATGFFTQRSKDKKAWKAEQEAENQQMMQQQQQQQVSQQPVYSKYGGKVRSFNNGGELTEYTGPDHEQNGVNFGNTQVEGGENEFNGVVNSKSYIFNKHLAKGLKMNNIDISKHIGKTPADAMRAESNKYSRTNDKFTDNALAQEQKNGTGKFAVENASKMIGDIVNPDAQIAKYGGQVRKFKLGGVDGFEDPDAEINSRLAAEDNQGFDYNKMYNAGNFLGAAYDVGRGLQGGDSVNYERVNPSLVDYSRSRDITRKDTKENLKNAKKNFRDDSQGNSGMLLNAYGQLTGQASKNIADSNARSFENELNMNAQITNQSKYANAATQRAEADARQMEKDIAKNTLSTGLYNFGSATTQLGVDQKNDKAVVKSISSKNDAWEMDEKTGTWKKRKSVKYNKNTPS